LLPGSPAKGHGVWPAALEPLLEIGFTAEEIKEGLRPTVIDPGTHLRTWGTPTELWHWELAFLRRVLWNEADYLFCGLVDELS
jgi:hypothetical protein